MGCSATEPEILQSVEGRQSDRAPQNLDSKSGLKSVIRDPLNCPIMIAANSQNRRVYAEGSSEYRDESYLYFRLVENPNFDIELGDSCEGDLKKLWPDLARFESEIEIHMPNIAQIRLISVQLKHFPQTQDEVKHYIDDQAKAAALHDNLETIDRTTAEGGTTLDNMILFFLRTKEQSYWLTEQAPIIENILSKYDLKMEFYSSEKTKYFYHPFKRGVSGEREWKRALEGTYELEYLGSTFDWFQFQKPAE